MLEPRPSTKGPFLREAVAVYVNEMRIQFRDGHVLISTLLLPLLLYPLLFWAMAEFVSVGRGRLEKTPARVGVAPADARHPLVRHIAGEEDALVVPHDDLDHALATGEVDAAIVIERNAAPGETRLRLRYDASRPRSERARERFRGWVERAEQAALEDRFAARGAGREEAVIFGYDHQNTATPEQMGSFLLGLLLPITMVAMTSMGAFYPAIDVLVGERERGTFEGLLASGASRLAIVAGKYLTVVTAAAVAGSLNLGSMLLTALQFLRSTTNLPTGGVALPPAAVPVMILGALLLGAFLGGAMILLASLARTFKEGQSLVTPFYTLAILPAMLTAYPGIRLDTTTALVPVMNIALLMRGALHGKLPFAPTALVLASTLLLTGLLLAFAAWLFRQEDVLVSDCGGSLTRYLRGGFVSGRVASPGAAGAAHRP